MDVMPRRYLALSLMIALNFLSYASTAWSLSGEWQTAAPVQVGLAPDISDQLDTVFRSGKLDDVHGVVLIRHGKLALERYWAGDGGHSWCRGNGCRGWLNLHEVDC